MPSKRLNAVICSDMSVCGVSAAIAAASACRAKKEELTLAVGLSLVFTAVMMIVMPAVIKSTFPVDKQMILGGAWMGGTIDASGAVAAAGAFLGEKALYVAATIKMIQNVLIGVIAFFVALYFTTRVEVAETGAKGGTYNEIILSAYHRGKGDFIYFINTLSQAEKGLNKALLPRLKRENEGVKETINRMEKASAKLRAKDIETWF